MGVTFDRTGAGFSQKIYSRILKDDIIIWCPVASYNPVHGTVI